MARIDPFFSDQPELSFVDELRSPMYKRKPRGFGVREPDAKEIDARGCYVDFRFPDPEGLLETAVADLSRFMSIFEIAGDRYPIIFEIRDGFLFESYRIIPTRRECLVIAGDTEGIRRAMIYIEDEFIAKEGAFFDKIEIVRTPEIKTRITRGFFSPTNRPPKNGDELSDDIDYYPDEYLNRIAHDGTNAIWIYTSFAALVRTKQFPEFGEGSEKRIEKLRRVIDKCARYGIKVYVFAIEPMYLKGEAAKRHEGLLGAEPFTDGVDTFHPICPLSDAGREYLIEATETLFRALPKLGGFMDITSGERITSCASTVHHRTCPRCKKYSRGEALARSVDAIKEGMRRAGTGADFISWTYGHRLWDDEDIVDYVRCAPDDVILMQNFDDKGYEEQLGRTREAIDYWLSYVGPSQMFRLTADAAGKYEKDIFAKMQVCCSHELATVPYIPAPGLIFDKFKEAYSCGVTGILECWYFGNYPSVMSKAAGELSFCNNFSDKDAFLRRIAKISVGESRAEALAEAYRAFEEGYKNYPINIMFSYYGPMHDGVVWELSLLPRDRELPRTWLLLDRPEGDRIHDCLWQGHTLEEAIILSERMLSSWGVGMENMKDLCDTETYFVAAMIYVLFSSGYNILRFYQLRDMLGRGEGDPKETLSEMRELVLSEIENSEMAKGLCNADPRLGYHSEAEGFKFFPKKLDARIAQLKELLETEFPEVLGRIERGLSPLEFYEGKFGGKYKDDAYFITEKHRAPEDWERIGEAGRFSLAFDGESLELLIDAPRGECVKIVFEFRLLYPETGISLSESGIGLVPEATTHQSLFGDRIARECGRYSMSCESCGDRSFYKLRAEASEFSWNGKTPIRLSIGIGEELDAKKFWKTDGEIHPKLGRSSTAPEQMGWIIPKAGKT